MLLGVKQRNRVLSPHFILPLKFSSLLLLRFASRIYSHAVPYIHICLIHLTVPEHHKHHQPASLPHPSTGYAQLTHFTSQVDIFFQQSQQQLMQRSDTWLSRFFFLGMAPKREPSIKKSPSPVIQPRLGPPYPCLPAVPAAPKAAPEQKPRMLRPSDSPFDPSTLEVSGES